MGSSKSNERVSTTIGTIELPRLAPSLLTLTGSCKIYYVFEIKAPSPFRACLHGGGGPQVGEVTRLGEVKK